MAGRHWKSGGFRTDVRIIRDRNGGAPATTSGLAALGYSDNIIAELSRHHVNTITNRYTHLTEKVVVDAANVVSEKIAELIGV